MIDVWFASDPFSSLAGMSSGGEMGGLEDALNAS
jgi:hypothetical protein